MKLTVHVITTAVHLAKPTLMQENLLYVIEVTQETHLKKKKKITEANEQSP